MPPKLLRILFFFYGDQLFYPDFHPRMFLLYISHKFFVIRMGFVKRKSAGFLDAAGMVGFERWR